MPGRPVAWIEPAYDWNSARFYLKKRYRFADCGFGLAAWYALPVPVVEERFEDLAEKMLTSSAV